MKAASFELKPIGVVRSPAKVRKELPPPGAPASVEVFEEYSAGLLKLDKHSHLWVLAWLNEAARDTMQVTPRGVEDPGPGGLHGVFAVRSPTRPNPLGLTLARITGREGRRIDLERLDFTDGTPVVDLKPYFVSKDMVFSATNEQIGKPAGREALLDSMKSQALQFAGASSPDLELAAEICADFRCEVLQFADPGELRITVPSARQAMMDAFMGMCRVSPGRGSLRWHRADAVLFEHGGCRYEYLLEQDSFRRRV